ncbi:hypothetical protein RA307_26045 [Xanthobacteraceae bacterium Astr-EGSB]|uniref:transcriptional regulator n=1 Tax=Astrobacterium formosum TaxID=3069710 RepID=UPI0027B6A4A6|nr:hypothetical protein [Xanthobacteraceae bacterium Astr-EGSB]
MNSTNARQQVPTPAFLKEQRARDAELAMREYQAERLAVLATSQRLRALRLAKERSAKDVPGAPTKAPTKAPKARVKPVRKPNVTSGL